MITYDPEAYAGFGVLLANPAQSDICVAAMMMGIVSALISSVIMWQLDDVKDIAGRDLNFDRVVFGDRDGMRVVGILGFWYYSGNEWEYRVLLCFLW